MTLTSAPFLPKLMSPILSARLSELAQFMGAPLAGRLTEEQRSLCLAIARRLVASVARRIDQQIDVAALWKDWLEGGLPHHEALILACFSRAEEHRWRSITEQEVGQGELALFCSPGEPELPMPWPVENEDLRRAYMDLQLADRRRADPLGYPALAVADVEEDIYRHLLNEIARWRLGQVSRDRNSAAGLGDAVRHAWQQRARETSLDHASQCLVDIVRRAGRVAEEIEVAILRRDWLSFIALTSAAHERPYTDMALFWLSSTVQEREDCLTSVGIAHGGKAALEASITALSSRAVNEELAR